jgi:hypothetical protein
LGDFHFDRDCKGWKWKSPFIVFQSIKHKKMANFNKVFALAVFTALIFTSCNRHIVAQKEVKQYYYDALCTKIISQINPANVEHVA